MERHLIADDILVDRTNARLARPTTKAPLVVTNQAQRKSLFSRPEPPESKRPEPRATSAAHSSPLSSFNNASLVAPSQSGPSSRIPRPGGGRPSPPQTRKSFGLTDAFRMAEEEDEQKNAAQMASPSPAPRPRAWRTTRSPGAGTTPNSSTSPATETKYLRTRRSRHENPAQSSPAGAPAAPGITRPQSGDLSDSDPDIDQKIRQHALEQGMLGERADGDNDFTSRAASGTITLGTGHALVRRASGGCLEQDSPLTPARRQAVGSNAVGTAIPTRLVGRGNDSHESLRAAGRDATGGLSRRFGDTSTPRPATVPPAFLAPADKNMAWQVEADFTAYDVQSSNSPPVSLGRRINRKIDDIQALEAAVSLRVSVSPKTRAHNRPRNTRIDEIRALEQDTTRPFPADQDSTTEHHESRASHAKQPARETENAGRFRRNQQIGRINTKIDELRTREREAESLSLKQVALNRLDEPCERSHMSDSRSPSPITPRTSGRKAHLEPPPTILQGGEHLQPLPGQQSAAGTASALPLPSGGVQAAQPSRVYGSKQSQQHTPGPGSGDILARDNALSSTQRPPVTAKNSSPVTIPILAKDAREASEKGEVAEPVSGDSLKSEIGAGAKVAGHLRNLSSDSSDKRSELARSESDPTERIQGEMLLFEPLENQSERGISRAPSPELDEDEDEDVKNGVEETPKPTKTDPRLLATPQVTGAYLDTPATARTGELAFPNATPEREATEPGTALHPMAPSPRRGRGSSFVPRTAKQTLSAKGDRRGRRALSISRHRRGKSLPRAGSPVLMNSAKPPTAHEDLLEIHRMHQIDDSTLDDFDELVEGHEVVGQREKSPAATEKKPLSLSERERELEAYDRMSKTLKTGLLGIRTAKQGIERLQDQVLHGEVKKRRLSGGKRDMANAPVAACTSSGKSTAHLQIPIPRLWHRSPKFRFTMLGVGVLLFMLWYVAESGMCYMYCRPTYCYSGRLCRWSPDDPNWGYSLPVKLDQWITNGQGRALVRRVRPDVEDWIADIWDAATGTDITQVDTRGFDLDRKRQYRRRLQKRGFLKVSQGPADERPIYDAWRVARLARERADSAREMGYDQGVFFDERIAADESV